MPSKPVDFAKVFEELSHIARTCESSQAGWRDMCAVAAKSLGQGSIKLLATLDLDTESQRVRVSLRKVVKKEPPPRTIDTLLFGLFDAADGNQTSAGYYVAGVSGFDADDGDSLCDPAWWPKGRYLHSDALNTIFSAAKEAKGDSYTMLDYALRFGAAALISRFAAQDLPHRVVVGFDEGDFAEVMPPAADRDSPRPKSRKIKTRKSS